MNLETTIEGVLFYASEPMTLGHLSSLLEVEMPLIETALLALTKNLEGRGVRIVRQADRVALMTSAELSGVIDRMRKEELKGDIGKAGAETLAIIAYHEGISRAEIDFIRGVNSTFILRNLLIRGLIERIPNPKDSRTSLYRPTLELYAHLGITKKEELPDYAEMIEEIKKYKNSEQEKNISTNHEEVHEENNNRQE